VGINVKTLNFTGFTGTWAPFTSSFTFYGNLTLVSGMTFTTGSGVFTFANTSGTTTITPAGKTLNPITQNGVGGTFALTSDLTIVSSTTGIFVLTAGTLNLAGFTLSAGAFTSNNTNTRVIQFGSGAITVTSTGSQAFFVNGTGLTYTGTPTVNISNNSATSLTINTATGFTETNAFNFNVTTGTYTLTVTTAGVFKSLIFTGFTGTWSSGSTSVTFYGSLTLVSGMTYSATTGTYTFANTSGTAIITAGGKTFGPITINAPGGTVQLADTFSQATTRAFTYTAGTVDINSQTNTFGVLTITSYPTITNGPLNATTVTQSSGTVTVPASSTAKFTSTGAYTFTAGGTIDLSTNNSVLSVGSFVSTGSATRVIQFGTGAITTTGSGTAFNATGTNLTYTGTPTVNISNNSGTATTVTASTGFTETNAFNFNITVGSYTLTMSGGVFKSLNFTGFTGSYSQSTLTLYGSLTLASGMTYTPTGSTITFANTSGTAIITCAGKTLGVVTQNGAGGTVQLADALSSNSTLTLTAGIFDANNFNVSVKNFSSSNTNTRTLTMGSGLWSLSGDLVPWTLDTVTNLTFNKGTANIVLSGGTNNNVRSFSGGGLTYNTLTIGGGSETSTSVRFYQGDTFDTLASTKTVAYTLILLAGATMTVGNFNVSGSAGNLITLRSSISGTQAILSKVNGTVNVNYLSIQDSNATGGAVWNPGADSINVSNNSGWQFAAPVTTGTGNFFLLFA